MFNQPGKKIQKLAIVVFVILLIFDLLFAFGISSFFDSRAGISWIGTVIGFIIIVIGAIISWVSVIILYSFGCLVEDVEYIRTRLDMTEEDINEDSLDETY